MVKLPQKGPRLPSACLVAIGLHKSATSVDDAWLVAWLLADDLASAPCDGAVGTEVKKPSWHAAGRSDKKPPNIRADAVHSLHLPSRIRLAYLHAQLHKPVTLCGMVTLKPEKLRAVGLCRKRSRSSTSRGTYTASVPVSWKALLCMSGLLLCATGLPMIPNTCRALFQHSQLAHHAATCRDRQHISESVRGQPGTCSHATSSPEPLNVPRHKISAWQTAKAPEQFAALPNPPAAAASLQDAAALTRPHRNQGCSPHTHPAPDRTCLSPSPTGPSAACNRRWSQQQQRLEPWWRRSGSASGTGPAGLR